MTTCICRFADHTGSMTLHDRCHMLLTDQGEGRHNRTGHLAQSTHADIGGAHGHGHCVYSMHRLHFTFNHTLSGGVRMHTLQNIPSRRCALPLCTHHLVSLSLDHGLWPKLLCVTSIHWRLGRVLPTLLVRRSQLIKPLLPCDGARLCAI